ncbi:MAG: hypothetical protein AB1673_06335 [Actinomycetota bacterium]
MRLTLAVLAAAAVGAAGALVLGEYPFTGPLVVASAVVLGLFIGEAALAVARGPSLALGVACGAVGLAAMVWAGWITTSHDLSFLGPVGWTAVVVTGVTAGVRTGWSRPGADSRRHERTPAPPAEPGRG